MGTTRERREARAERLREWADKREATAAALHARNEVYRGDVAFNTQPGHIPERARAIARTERAWENERKAASMTSRAASIEAATAGSIFSDDEDAVEALEARIAELEAERERIKRFNATARKGAPDYSLLTEAEKRNLLDTARTFAVSLSKGGGFPAYKLANLSGNIKRNRDRLVQVKAQQARAAAAEDAGGVTVELIGGGRYARVTFADKPERSIIDELKAAGFRWGGGSWTGDADKLPEEVTNA